MDDWSFFFHFYVERFDLKGISTNFIVDRNKGSISAEVSHIAMKIGDIE